MTISREKCSEMVREADLDWQRGFCLSGEINRYEDLINLAYAEGQRNMKNRAVKVCMDLERKERDHATGYGSGYLIYTVSDCEVEIRKLEVGK